MFRDLDPQNWPDPRALLDHPFITGLMQDGFPQSDSLYSDESFLDDLIPVSRLDHVVDADGTQTQAIEAVRQGRSLVIQGPPGTGKSQSITNIISSAVLDGKRVLFVAEKLAALEVVKRRLEKEGLGDVCLELHSNKSKKRGVCLEAVLQIDLDPLSKRIRNAATTLANLRETTLELAANLSQPLPESFAEIEEQRIIAGFVAQAPILDKEALCNGVWDSELDALRVLVEEGRKFVEAQNKAGKKIVEAVWEKEFSEARSQIVAHGQSIFRILNAKYRAAIAEIRGVLSAESQIAKLESEHTIDETNGMFKRT